MRFSQLVVLILALGLVPAPGFADEKIRVTATTGTIASLTQSIAGEMVEIYTIASPNRNIHFLEPTPKDVLKTRKADVFIHGGLDLEVWREPLLNASGRGDFISGERAINVSQGIEFLNVPSEVDRAHGDIHLFGNPHYSSDPENAKIMASNIAEGLSALYPDNAAQFRKNAAALIKRLDSKIAEWQKRLAPYKNAPVVTYHDSWPYFMRRFHFEILGFLEPKPGIPPTAKHIQGLVHLMKERQVRIIIREVFNEGGTPHKIAKETGAQVVTLMSEPGEMQGGYLAAVEHNVAEMEKILKN